MQLTFFCILDGSRGGVDEVDNESDYGWEEEEVPVQQDVEKEKLQSRVKTEPLGMHLFALW